VLVIVAIIAAIIWAMFKAGTELGKDKKKRRRRKKLGPDEWSDFRDDYGDFW
jgi:hypothetical protein